MGREKQGFASRPENINRNGRPKKGQTLTDILNAHADKEDIGKEENKISRREALAQKLWQMALGGDIAAIRYIYDRIDGKPTEHHEMTGTGIPVIFNGIDPPEEDEEEEESE